MTPASVSVSVSKGKREKKGTSEKDQKEIGDLLAAIGPDFHGIWERWKDERKRRRLPLTDYAQVLQLRRCREWGKEKAIKAIKTSITRHWRDLFEPDVDDKNKKMPHATAQQLYERALNTILMELERTDPDNIGRVLKACRDKWKDCKWKGNDPVTDAYTLWKERSKKK